MIEIYKYVYKTTDIYVFIRVEISVRELCPYTQMIIYANTVIKHSFLQRCL
jgi:hypothetical protein